MNAWGSPVTENETKEIVDCFTTRYSQNKHCKGRKLFQLGIKNLFARQERKITSLIEDHKKLQDVLNNYEKVEKRFI